MQAAWNCLSKTDSRGLSKHLDHAEKGIDASRSSKKERISVTFDMNKLHRIPVPPDVKSPGRILVSMNPIHEPAKELVQGVYVYDHPLFDAQTMIAQKRIPEINGTNSISYAGAWMGYGFHEDGFRAGLEAANTYLRKHHHAVHPNEHRRLRKVEHPRPFLETLIRLLIAIVQCCIVGCK